MSTVTHDAYPRQPLMGWTALSRDALRRAEASLGDAERGVRDEVGVLALHTGYANRFFPGTSVQQTRLRYALLVPWQIKQLLSAHPLLSPSRAREALSSAELELALRLPQEEGAGTIGRFTAREGRPVSIPPSASYWVALRRWGIIADDRIGRRDLFGAWASFAKASRPAHSALRDDDRVPLDIPVGIFGNALPPAPADFHGQGKLSFTLSRSERSYLRTLMGQLQREDGEPALLAKLVDMDRVPRSLHARSVSDLADKDDRVALKNARRASSLALIARALYNAILEALVEREQNLTSTRHRARLASVLDEHATRALRLDLGCLAEDGITIGGLEAPLRELQRWIREDGKDPLERRVHRSWWTWEERKGDRAKLPLNATARHARLAWRPERATTAYGLDFRWGVVTRFLQDLREA